jgi:phosphate transport system permease protein
MSTTLEPMEEFEADLGTASLPEPTPTSTERPDRPRAIGKRSSDDWFVLIGSMAASLAMVWLLYFHILPFSGPIGFVICWYLAFVVFYAGITATTQSRAVVTDRIASAAIHGGAGMIGLALGATLVYTFVKGWPAYHHLNFLTHDMSHVAPTDPLSQGGIEHALIGSSLQLAIAIAVSLPLGILTAVYLTEVGGRLAVPVRTVIEAMTALPDLVAGLFVYVILVLPPIRLEKVGLAAGIAISITMLPIIARSAEVVLRSVPSGLREASAALGSPQWRTVFRVVLPTAKAGLGTALILGMARGVGETAPVIIVSKSTTFSNANVLSNPMESLPLFIYTQLRGVADPNAYARGYGAASVLLAFILVLFVIIRLLARDRTGR